jgi:hypothetical protein
LKPVTRTYRQKKYEGDIVKFENEEVDFAVTPNHKMVVIENDDIHKENAAQLLHKQFEIPGEGNVKVLPEHSSKAKYSGSIVCVEVEDNHTVLAGRNGKFNWTGQSVYGVLGLPVFRFYDIDNAEAVTKTGVSTIKYTSKMGDHYYKKHGDSDAGLLNECIYTDSVPGYEPVIVRYENDEVDIRPIEEIEREWKNLEVWSDGGWTQINDFIKKPNRKQLYTTRTREGVVHTTEDHSLVREDGSEVSPNEVEEGEKLLHNPIPEKSDWSDNGDAEKSWLLGFFVAEGSCGTYDTDYGRKHSWAINNQKNKLLEKSASIMESEYNVGTKIDEVLESSNTNKLRLNGNGYGSVRDISQIFRRKCYTSNGEKRVPKEVLNSESREVVEAFLDGLHDGDGRVNERYTKRWHEFTTKSPTLASGIPYLLRRLGYESGVSYKRNHGGNEYYKVTCQERFRDGSKEVDEVQEIEYNGDYVYDLETKNQHFHCGIGSIVVHNTDSVFYSSIPLLDEDPEDMGEDEVIEATIDKAKELQSYLNRSYDYYARKILNIPKGQHRFDIKQELVASRGIWMSAKKRYAQWIVNDEGDPTSELDVKGMDIVRSDFPPAFDDVMEKVVVTILKENDQDRVDEIILNFEDKLHDFAIEEVANPTGVGEISDYQKPTMGQYKKGAPVYFKAALVYNELLEHFGIQDEHEPIRENSKIKWVYLHDNPLGLDQVGFKGDGDPKEIMDFIGQYADYDKMYQKALKSKLKDIYEAVDWKFPSAGKKRAEEFFQF